MAKEKANRVVYDESKVQTLSSLEHIRLRSGMYIGRLGDGSNPDDGIYILFKEVIDNAVDEHIMGYGDRIEIQILDNLVKVRDFGRGIPLGKVIECVSVINTGAKFNDDVFQFSVGLNGVGAKAVNALSDHYLVRSHRGGRFHEACFRRGQLVVEREGSTKEPDGTYVEFHPDEEIFPNYGFNEEFILRRLWNYAYLNPGLALVYNGQVVQAQGGLLDFLQTEVGDKALYPVMHFRSRSLEFAFTHTGDYGEMFWSFVNGQYTPDGGTHLTAFKEGLLRGVNAYFNENFNGQDLREGMAAAIAVRIKNPIFESQTKNKLGNSDLRSELVPQVKQEVERLLHSHPEVARHLKQKIQENESLRRELAQVRREARDISRRTAIKIPNLKDCKYHVQDGELGKNSMIFVTEGQSASGSMVSCRDPLTQAIFSLRGKPRNMFDAKKSEIYKHDELCYLMIALGIEQDVQNLRYDKVILATDADQDGFHIRNILLTFFLQFFEELAVAGKLFILETPLYRVRNKKETVYCYSEKERDQAVKRLAGAEVTRFKGLGEISPREFGQFIDPKTMRLVSITVRSLKEIKNLLSFYMGENDASRRRYIIENLI